MHRFCDFVHSPSRCHDIGSHRPALRLMYCLIDRTMRVTAITFVTLPAPKNISTQAFKHTSIQAHKHSSTQAFKHTGIQAPAMSSQSKDSIRAAVDHYKKVYSILASKGSPNLHTSFEEEYEMNSLNFNYTFADLALIFEKPSTYQARVSFDTFNNPSVTDQTFTLVSKHRGYTYARHSRVFLVAIDQNAYSEHALKWLIQEMVEDGDEIICLRVIESDTKADKAASKELMISYKNDAKELLEHIQAKNDAADKKALSIIMEFAYGSVEETILHMVGI